MKIIFLNVFKGNRDGELRDFLKQHAPDTDVFCFQEAYDSFHTLAAPYLKDFVEYKAYAVAFRNESGVEDFAQATYVRSNIKVKKIENLKDENHIRGLGIYTLLDDGKMRLSLLNYHGVSVPTDKLDTPDRLKQSKDIIDYFSGIESPKILGGDFNFAPGTRSYRSIKTAGYMELVMDAGIMTTTNHLYWNKNQYRHKFSDYIYTSGDLNLVSLEVPDIVVSDHLPLILEVAPSAGLSLLRNAPKPQLLVQPVDH